jgi:hypothetical protein
MVKFFTCDVCGTSRDLWQEWVEDFVSSGEFGRRAWLTARWVTADEAALRFGIPRCHVIELAGFWRARVPWTYPDDPEGAPKLDARAFRRLKGLKAKQNTFLARQFQRRWGLSHILPTAWDRLDKIFP